VEQARALGVFVSVFPCSPSLNAFRRKGLFASVTRHLPALFSFLAYVIKIRRFAGKIRPAVIHANVPKSHVTLFLLARLGFKGTTCFHIREIFDPASAPFRLYSLLCPKNNAMVIAISKAVRDALPLSMQEKSQVIYNGIEIPFHPRPIPDSPAVRFLYLGRVVPWKGCHLLIDAFSRLPKNAGHTLDIVGDTMYGDSSYRVLLNEQIARAGLRKTCRLLPHTAKPHDAFITHDVFCIGSDKEPFGRVVAEAMAYGLPVIGFCSGGLPELVEDGASGILVEEGSVEAFTAAMRRFTDKREMITVMGGAARTRARELFEKKKQAERIVDVMVERTRKG